MNSEIARLEEIQKQIEIEKRNLLAFGETGVSKVQTVVDTWNELRLRPFEAALLVICGGILLAKTLDRSRRV